MNAVEKLPSRNWDTKLSYGVARLRFENPIGVEQN